MPSSDTGNGPSRRKLPALLAHWLGWFLLYLGLILLSGGILGALVYLGVGAFTHPELPLTYRLSKGFLNGLYYAGVWATGLSLVLCTMRAWRDHAGKPTSGESPR